MDFDFSKENIQPLRGGRNVTQLEVALQAQSDSELQKELLQQKESFEEAIRTYEGDDPLDNWYNYISWVEQSYPKHGHEGNLVPLLEDCLAKFEHDERYIHDRRLCKLWIKYIDLQQNPLELFQLLHSKGICISCSDLYRAWAYYHEVAEDYKRADAVFQLGLRALAQPYEELVTARENMFLAIGKQTIQGVDERRLQDQRHALTSLRTYKHKQRTLAPTVRTGGQVLHSTPGILQMITDRKTKSNIPVVSYEDTEVAGPSIRAGSAPVSILDIARKQEIVKENTLKPGTWKAKKNIIAHTSASQQRAPTFKVHQDEEPQLPEGIRLPPDFCPMNHDDFSDWKKELFYPEPVDERMIPMYPKHLVYAEQETEYSPEEIKARKWFSKLQEKLQNAMSNANTSVNMQETMSGDVNIVHGLPVSTSVLSQNSSQSSSNSLNFNSLNSQTVLPSASSSLPVSSSVLSQNSYQFGLPGPGLPVSTSVISQNFSQASSSFTSPKHSFVTQNASGLQNSNNLNYSSTSRQSFMPQNVPIYQDSSKSEQNSRSDPTSDFSRQSFLPQSYQDQERKSFLPRVSVYEDQPDMGNNSKAVTSNSENYHSRQPFFPQTVPDQTLESSKLAENHSQNSFKLRPSFLPSAISIYEDEASNVPKTSSQTYVPNSQWVQEASNVPRTSSHTYVPNSQWAQEASNVPKASSQTYVPNSQWAQEASNVRKTSSQTYVPNTQWAQETSNVPKTSSQTYVPNAQWVQEASNVPKTSSQTYARNSQWAQETSNVPKASSQTYVPNSQWAQEASNVSKTQSQTYEEQQWVESSSKSLEKKSDDCSLIDAMKDVNELWKDNLQSRVEVQKQKVTKFHIHEDTRFAREEPDVNQPNKLKSTPFQISCDEQNDFAQKKLPFMPREEENCASGVSKPENSLRFSVFEDSPQKEKSPFRPRSFASQPLPEIYCDQPKTSFFQPKTPFSQTETPFSQPKTPFSQTETPFSQPKTPFSQQKTPFSQPKTPFSESKTPFSQPFNDDFVRPDDKKWSDTNNSPNSIPFNESCSTQFFNVNLKSGQSSTPFQYRKPQQFSSDLDFESEPTETLKFANKKTLFSEIEYIDEGKKDQWYDPTQDKLSVILETTKEYRSSSGSSSGGTTLKTTTFNTREGMKVIPEISVNDGSITDKNYQYMENQVYSNDQNNGQPQDINNYSMIKNILQSPSQTSQTVASQEVRYSQNNQQYSQSQAVFRDSLSQRQSVNVAQANNFGSESLSQANVFRPDSSSQSPRQSINVAQAQADLYDQNGQNYRSDLSQNRQSVVTTQDQYNQSNNFVSPSPSQSVNVTSQNNSYSQTNFANTSGQYPRQSVNMTAQNSVYIQSQNYRADSSMTQDQSHSQKGRNLFGPDSSSQIPRQSDNLNVSQDRYSQMGSQMNAPNLSNQFQQSVIDLTDEDESKKATNKNRKSHYLMRFSENEDSQKVQSHKIRSSYMPNFESPMKNQFKEMSCDSSNDSLSSSPVQASKMEVDTNNSSQNSNSEFKMDCDSYQEKSLQTVNCQEKSLQTVNCQEKPLQTVDNLEEAPSDPFSAKVINSLLTKIGFPQPKHAKNFIQLPSLPRSMSKKDVVTFGKDKYSVEKSIGKGAFGFVYKATNVKTNEIVALKYQKPANKWEFYIVKEVQERITNPYLLRAFMDVSMGYYSQNASLLVSEFCKFGSLLDLSNIMKQKTGRGIRELVAIYYAIEIITIVNALHQCEIIHADIKPDNFLVTKMPPEFGYPSLQLIDFGNSIDMTLFPKGTSFTKIITTEDFQCTEMKDGRPWTYQTDIFCLAATVHVLLFEKYMQVNKRDGIWAISQKIPRYMRTDLWNTFFFQLLNIDSCDKLPDLASIKSTLESIISTENEALQADLRFTANKVIGR